MFWIFYIKIVFIVNLYLIKSLAYYRILEVNYFFVRFLNTFLPVFLFPVYNSVLPVGPVFIIWYGVFLFFKYLLNTYCAPCAESHLPSKLSA